MVIQVVTVKYVILMSPNIEFIKFNFLNYLLLHILSILCTKTICATLNGKLTAFVINCLLTMMVSVIMFMFTHHYKGTN